MIPSIDPVSGTVFIYPSEYNVFANSAVPAVTWKQNDKYPVTRGDWVRQYNITDHLGSVVSRIQLNELGMWSINGSSYFDVAGNKISVIEDDRGDRLRFIGKEFDQENNLGDFGVRKYDSDLGMFTSIDPL